MPVAVYIKILTCDVHIKFFYKSVLAAFLFINWFSFCVCHLLTINLKDLFYSHCKLFRM